MEQSRRKGGGDSSYCEPSKRKNKHKSSYRFLQNAADWYRHQPVSEFSAGQWNSQGQRLYPTVSDSAVCGYSYPYDCVVGSFPIYPVVSANMYPVELEHVRRPFKLRKNNKYLDVDNAINGNANFTSLPPVNIANISSSERRRFSDPGLNNVDESNESSSNDSTSDSCSLVSETLLDQISELKSENKRLVNELQSTKDELKTLKSEFTIMSSKLSCHEPFSLAQMVKEIRDAAEAREKILLSKVETLIDNGLNSNNMTNIATEIESLKKRLSQLEHQLEHVRIHSKVESKLNGEATSEELDNAAKRKLTPVEIISKFEINHEQAKEESYPSLRLDLNTGNTESTSDCNGNSLSTVSYESLSSSLGPGSISSATLTVCGPVTDL